MSIDQIYHVLSLEVELGDRKIQKLSNKSAVPSACKFKCPCNILHMIESVYLCCRYYKLISDIVLMLRREYLVNCGSPLDLCNRFTTPASIMKMIICYGIGCCTWRKSFISSMHGERERD